MAFKPKSSKAVHLWIGILAGVLVVLFFETGTGSASCSNFLVNTNADAIGAEIFLDGKKLGVIQGSSGKGMDGGGFWAHVTRGKHTVEVRKNDFRPFKTVIDMHNEAYLGVDLKRATN